MAEDGATEEEMVGRGVRGRGHSGGRLRQREVVNLWWLTGVYTLPGGFLGTKDMIVAQRSLSIRRLFRVSGLRFGSVAPSTGTVITCSYNAEKNIFRIGG